MNLCGKVMSKDRKLKHKHSRKHDGFTGELRTAVTEERYANFDEIIRSIPAGKVATYGQIADAAGYPRGHRLVARFLRDMHSDDLPWQRVIGAGGELKTSGR